CFVIPNPWDVGSARYLARLGFKALATTSSGFAWSRGHADNGVSVDDALNHFEDIARSVEIPVNGDFEGGFAVDPGRVEANVRRAVAPRPVNVLVGGDHTTVAELEKLGVRRISVGGALARAAWRGFMNAAGEIAREGTFHGLAAAVSFADVNGLFEHA